MLDQHDVAAGSFAEACREGTGNALRAVLHPSVVAICDGGGLVPAALGPVHGADDVVPLVIVLLCGKPHVELTVEAVNGRAGVALRHAGRAVAVVAITAVHARVTALWIVLNPEKLRGWHR